jgi:protein-disulfide isomerase
VVYRHFPISKLHPSASAAAYASICAAKQGRFQAYYNFAFEQQDSIGKLPWAAVADRVGGLDTVVFARCLKDSTSLMAVQYDRAVADRLKVSGTPTVLVNQWRLRGAPSTAALDSMVRKVLQGVR